MNQNVSFPDPSMADQKQLRAHFRKYFDTIAVIPMDAINVIVDYYVDSKKVKRMRDRMEALEETVYENHEQRLSGVELGSQTLCAAQDLQVPQLTPEWIEAISVKQVKQSIERKYKSTESKIRDDNLDSSETKSMILTVSNSQLRQRQRQQPQIQQPQIQQQQLQQQQIQQQQIQQQQIQQQQIQQQQIQQPRFEWYHWIVVGIILGMSMCLAGIQYYLNSRSFPSSLLQKLPQFPSFTLTLCSAEPDRITNLKAEGGGPILFGCPPILPSIVPFMGGPNRDVKVATCYQLLIPEISMEDPTNDLVYNIKGRLNTTDSRGRQDVVAWVSSPTTTLPPDFNIYGYKGQILGLYPGFYGVLKLSYFETHTSNGTKTGDFNLVFNPISDGPGDIKGSEFTLHVGNEAMNPYVTITRV